MEKLIYCFLKFSIFKIVHYMLYTYAKAETKKLCQELHFEFWLKFPALKWTFCLIFIFC